MLRLSKALHVPSFRRWLAEMTSREYTEYRAMAIIEAAQQRIADPKQKQASVLDFGETDEQRRTG